MSLSFGGVFADAGALWRAHRDLLMRVAGVFTFLPVFALQLFVQVPDFEKLSDDARMAAVAQWYGTNSPWLLLAMAVQFVGAATVLVLLLDPGRPTVGRAITHVALLLPGLLLAVLGTGLLVGVSTLLFLVPGMYAIGRTYLVWAVLVAEPERGPLAGFAEALRLTRGHGWMLFAVTMTVLLPAWFAAELIAAIGSGVGVLGNVVTAALTALLSAAAGIAQLLLQTAAYRGLRQGI